MLYPPSQALTDIWAKVFFFSLCVQKFVFWNEKFQKIPKLFPLQKNIQVQPALIIKYIVAFG